MIFSLLTRKVLRKFLSIFNPQKDGSLPVSKFFRKVFELKTIKLSFGLNLALGVFLVNNFIKPHLATAQLQEAILAEPKQQIHTEPANIIPVTGPVSQGYHWYHPGIDILSDFGTDIHCLSKGSVIEVTSESWGYGNKVMVEHDNGLTSLYAHLNEIMVNVGDEIEKNSIVGTIGLTGWTTGPHLHLEIYKDGKSIDPLTILPESEELDTRNKNVALNLQFDQNSTSSAVDLQAY